jgi:predicted Rossmann fold nucleotide-binding protein DprA/Smf involved in DNA uptake
MSKRTSQLVQHTYSTGSESDVEDEDNNTKINKSSKSKKVKRHVLYNKDREKKEEFANWLHALDGNIYPVQLDARFSQPLLL